MLDAVTEAVEQALDPQARARLSGCLPMLAAALASWRGAVAPDTALVIAAATPRASVVLTADGWLGRDQAEAAKLDRAGLVAALAAAIEAPASPDSTNRVLVALCVLLGSEGITAQTHIAAQMRAAGTFPLLVLLVEPPDAAALTVALPPPTAGATVH